MTRATRAGLPDRLVEFVGALRGHGIAVGPGETVDAAAAVDVIGLADRAQLREALAATTLRRSGQRDVFDAVFDLYFPVAVGAAETASGKNPSDITEFRDALVDALAANDRDVLRALAAAGVDAFGGYGSFGDGGSGGSGGGAVDAAETPGSGAGGLSGWSGHQTLDRVRPDALLDRVLAAMRAARPDDDPLDGSLADAVARQEARTGIAEFSQEVRAEALRRVSELRGRERVARHGIPPSADLVTFTSAGRAQLAEIGRTIQPLSRKLATALAARRRRATRGQIDLRRTLRRSLATGGVPMRPVLRNRRPGRPELVLLCDMSGSVARFAQFTLLLVQALRDQFSKVRAFAFIEITDEITDLIGIEPENPEALAARVMLEARLTRWGMSTDYGSALATFRTDWPDAVGPRTSVLILGDGRTNGGNPNLPAIRDIRERARHVYWLNPEPAALWGSGDSAATRYARLVPMHECRNVRQLAQLVTDLLPS